MSSTGSQREGLKTAAMALNVQRLNREETLLQAMESHDVERHTGKPMPDDDTVHVGDVTNHYPAPEKSEKPAASGIAKLALGAALMATGIGGGFGAAMLLDGGKDVIDNAKDKPEIRYLLDLGGGQEVSEGSEGNR